MITQPYTRLVLSEATSFSEVSPASLMDGVNAVQLSAEVYEATGDVTITVQVSNDAENWTEVEAGNSISCSSPGFFVMVPDTGICTRYVRVHASLEFVDGAQAILAVTQQLMKL